MLKYMLDTNICIYTMRNRPAKVRATFKRHQDQLCVSAITLMELIKGCEKSANPEFNQAILEGFVSRMEVLDFDRNAAVHAGQIIAELEMAGKSIGAYDNQIAGHARSRGLILVTNNGREFKRAPGLRVENWM